MFRVLLLKCSDCLASNVQIGCFKSSSLIFKNVQIVASKRFKLLGFQCLVEEEFIVMYVANLLPPWSFPLPPCYLTIPM